MWMRRVPAAGGVFERDSEGLERPAPEESLAGEGCDPWMPGRTRGEVVGRGLEAGAADDVEGHGVGLKDADFGLQREVVVEGIADGGRG